MLPGELSNTATAASATPTRPRAPTGRPTGHGGHADRPAAAGTTTSTITLPSSPAAAPFRTRRRGRSRPPPSGRGSRRPPGTLRHQQGSPRSRSAMPMPTTPVERRSWRCEGSVPPSVVPTMSASTVCQTRQSTRPTTAAAYHGDHRSPPVRFAGTGRAARTPVTRSATPATRTSAAIAPINSPSAQQRPAALRQESVAVHGPPRHDAHAESDRARPSGMRCRTRREARRAPPPRCRPTATARIGRDGVQRRSLPW